jgi:hypothetical protein
VTITDPLYTEDDIDFTGNDSVGGTDVGSYDMELDPEDFTNENPNFDVTFEIVDGELEIVKKAVKVTVTENSATKVYNGFEQSVTGYSWSDNCDLYTEAMATFSGEAIAKGIEIGNYDMNVLATDFANTNSNFTVTFEVVDGQLTITPLETEVIVTITEHSGNADYDPFESFKKAATQEMAEDEAALMVLHPGYVDKYIYDTSYITKNRALEVDFAINPEVPKWCAENGVQLLTYADL